jgi:cell division septal protein FtsQ
MIQKNKFFLLIFFFIILSTYSFNEQKQNASIIFPIKNIIIEDTLAVDRIKLKTELEFLRNTSLFFLKEKKIISATNKYGFISSVKLKKKYPNTLKISISENTPVATQVDGKKRYYLTQDGKKINFIELKFFEGLPVIFGSHKNFSFFFKNLEKSNFKINRIKAFYYFDIGRWDIVLKDEITIKLPKDNYQNILAKIDLILNDPSFTKYKILDYRIKDQLILQ